jgi:hypothetical protein
MAHQQRFCHGFGAGAANPPAIDLERMVFDNLLVTEVTSLLRERNEDSVFHDTYPDRIASGPV